ncbi:hypothetical protein F5148DRAFT_473249 [Russula earlei]|uniref:Uncharacterized protein n=1 Tax=Russula earlei TaxID=71964 RepID=A0ACC0UJG2_9AGAM|nr:hypothetical protein F5148DRAFT_473249 [Russula earlei]
MDLMQSFDAILFPADGRPPHVVSLMTSPTSFSNPHAPAQTSTARIPHPEVHMEYIAEDPNMRAWHFQFVEALDMMNKKFANPYIIYYPVVSRDGMPFPVNRTVRDMQEEVNKGRRLREDQLWRGNLVVAKFADERFTQMIDASMADFPILKNFLGTHASPSSVGTSASTSTGPGASPGAGSIAALPPHQHQHQHPVHLTPPTLPTAPLPPPHHPADLPAHTAAARHMPYAEPAAGGLQVPPHAYERGPSAAYAHAHGQGIPVAVPAPHREPKAHQHHHQQPPMEPMGL